jgi:hypothetical protein
VKRSTDTGLFCGVIPVDLATNPELLERVNNMAKTKTKTKKKTLGPSSKAIQTALVQTRWEILEIFNTDVPGLMELLEKDGEPVDYIHGCFRDVLARHGDDGGWNTNGGTNSKVFKYLEKVRIAAGRPDRGEVFYLVVKRA